MRVHLILDAEITTLAKEFTQEMSRSVRTAIVNALILAEQEGYTHPMENKIAIEVKEISGAIEGSGEHLLATRTAKAVPEKKAENIFTVFCQQDNGKGTTWISAVTAENSQQALLEGKKQCALEWQWPEETIRVVGIAAGDVTIVEWDDSPE